MNSRRNHRLNHHGRLRQPEAPGIPSSPEPTSPNLSDRQGTIPPPHSPELPAYRSRFSSLNYPYPPTAVPDHWHPSTQPSPLVPSNLTYIPRETTFTPAADTAHLDFSTGGVSEARPPLPVFPPDYASHGRIHWADESSDFSGSHKSSHRHLRATSASSQEISRPTSADAVSENSVFEEHSDVRNFDEDLEGLEVLAKYRPCTSCRGGTSPNAEEALVPSPVPSTHSGCHSDFTQQDIQIQPPSDVSNVQDGQATPPLVVRYEANKKPGSDSSCERRPEPPPSTAWTLFRKFNKKRPPEKVPDESPPVTIPKEVTEWTTLFGVGLHFAYIVLLAAAASLCLSANQPAATDGDLQVTTPASVQETQAPEEPIQRLGIRLPDHWVAIKVPDDEHEEEFLRKFFQSDRPRKKTSHRHRRPGEELPRNRTGISRGTSRHHHRHHVRPTMSDEQEALNIVTEGYRIEEEEKEPVPTNDPIKSLTRYPIWQDEQFIQRLKNHLESGRRSTLKTSTTTPLPLEVQVPTTNSHSETSKTDEGNSVVPKENAHTTHRIPHHPVIPYTFKKKIHLTRPTKDKTTPSKSVVGDPPENVLHRRRKPKDKAVIRFPETDIAPWNITEPKWNFENFYHIGKMPQQMTNRIGREKPETIVNPGSSEMKAPVIPLVIQVPPEFSSQPVSEKRSNTEFILLNLLFFTLTGSATLFLWDLYGRLTKQPLWVVPFLLFNIVWFFGMAITFAIFGSVFLAILLFILVALHISEVLVWLFSRMKKRRLKEKKKKKKKKKDAVTFDTALTE